MPKCKKCGKKGFFLSLYDDGYCEACLKEVKAIRAEEAAKAQENILKSQEARKAEALKKSEAEIKQAAIARLQRTKDDRQKRRASRVHTAPAEIYCGEKLKYSYEDVKLFTPDTMSVRVFDFNIGDKARLELEPDNTYDPNAVIVKANDKPIGYLYRGTLQDMVHDWKSKELPISCFVSDIDDENHIFWLDMAFYKNSPRVNPCKVFRLIGTKNEDVQENIGFSSEGEIVSYEYDFEKDKYEAIAGDIIGYFPTSATDLLDQGGEAYIKEIGTDDNGYYFIKVAIEYEED